MEFEAGIHQTRTADAQALLRAWADSGVRVFEVDTGVATEKTELIQCFAQVLPMDPPVSGRSWDAFDDSLWEGIFQLKETRVAIALRGECWANQPHGDAQTTLDVLQHVVELLEDEKATIGKPTKLRILLPDDN